MARLMDRYYTEIVPKLQTKLGRKNVLSLPRLQKVVLNMISTGVFTQLGHTYRGRMVDVVGANEKLRDRAARIVSDLSGAPRDQVDRALAEAHGSAKVAILMLRCGLAERDARARLSSAAGDLTVALGEAQEPRITP